MQFSGVTFADLESIAEAVGVSVIPASVNRRGFTGAMLRPSNNQQFRRRYRYTRPAWGGAQRLVWAVCWHGHAQFITEFFARFPEESIRTSFGGQTFVIVADDHGHDKRHGEFELEDWLAFSSDVEVNGGLTPNQLCNCGDNE